MMIRNVIQLSRALRNSGSLSSNCNALHTISNPGLKTCTEVTIPVPWGHVSGKWWGDQNKRPVLASHGWLDNAATYDRLVPLLSPETSVLAIDLPGHGRSSYIPRGSYYHRLEFVILLRRIVKHYGWDKVSLMGHSMSAGVSFVYSAMFPDEVDVLTLLDVLVPVPPPDKKLTPKAGKIVDKFLERDSHTPESAPVYSQEKLLDLVIKSMNSVDSNVDKETAKILLNRGAIQDSNGMYRLSSDPRLKDIRLSGFSMPEVLEMSLNLKTNVLFIKADKSPFYMPKEWLDKTWENVKKVAKSADLRMVPGSHHVHLQNPEVVAPIVNDFFLKYRCL